MQSLSQSLTLPLGSRGYAGSSFAIAGGASPSSSIASSMQHSPVGLAATPAASPVSPAAPSSGDMDTTPASKRGDLRTPLPADGFSARSFQGERCAPQRRLAWYQLPPASARAPIRVCVLSSRGLGIASGRRDAAVEHRKLAGMLPEMLQTIMDLLPSFSGRIRMRAVCRATAALEWRWAAPRRVDEELAGVALGDLGARAVAVGLRKAPNTMLGELCLGGNGIGDAGAAALAERLAEPGCALRRVALCQNMIGNAGGEALAAALSRNMQLEELDLWGNPMSAEVKRMILRAARCEVFFDDGRVRNADLMAPHTAKMRTILFDWIAQVHTGVNTPMTVNAAPDPQELLFRTFSHMDAYMACRSVPRSDLQLIGVACTLTAADVSGAGGADQLDLASWMSFVTDPSHSPEEIIDAATEVREALGVGLHRPTAYTFLRRYLRKTGWTEESFSLASYLIELAALDANFRLQRPQTIAAAAAVLSRQYIAQGVSVRSMPRWKARLLRCVGADLRQEIAPCIAAMSQLHAAQGTRSDLFVTKKYEWARLHRVANLHPNAPADAAHFEGYMRSG
mmetsp:Transcript_9800/g.28460  ORF Transcript_9800/g.28460 Transcript_9800/m.28460 type:complete len:568 (+) Transcript_9800:89-1792(+)